MWWTYVTSVFPVLYIFMGLFVRGTYFRFNKKHLTGGILWKAQTSSEKVTTEAFLITMFILKGHCPFLCAPWHFSAPRQASLKSYMISMIEILRLVWGRIKKNRKNRREKNAPKCMKNRWIHPSERRIHSPGVFAVWDIFDCQSWAEIGFFTDSEWKPKAMSWTKSGNKIEHLCSAAPGRNPAHFPLEFL